MSTESNEESIKKLELLLSSAQPQLHLAQVQSQNPATYSVSINFTEPTKLAGTFLDSVPVMRTGAGRLPKVGETVIVGYIGADIPFVQGVLLEGEGFKGIVTGSEFALGDDGNIVIDNGLLELKSQVKSMNDVLTRIHSIFTVLAKQPTPSPTAPLAPSIEADTVLLLADIGQLLK